MQNRQFHLGEEMLKISNTKLERIDHRTDLPPLEPGDHLDQETFHERYEAMPEDVKAELVGGIVYMPAALKRPHGRSHSMLNLWLSTYEVSTPGVEVYDNTTNIMGGDSEPQPDACLIIHPDKGGQMTFTPDDYLRGAPELVAEVASSTESYDLHSKKVDYERAGVKEYLVVALRQRKVFWFVNQNGKFDQREANEHGIFHSDVYPGLWLDAGALIQLDGPRLLDVLRQGLTTDAHTAFVKQLAAA